MISHERVYRKSPDIVSRNVVGEVILVPIRRRLADIDSLFALNEVAARIWGLIDGQRSLGAIRGRSWPSSDVAAAQADADLVTFFRQCHDIRAIQEVSPAVE